MRGAGNERGGGGGSGGAAERRDWGEHATVSRGDLALGLSGCLGGVARVVAGAGGSGGEPELLSNCYRNSLNLAVDNGINTISFPSISTGVYGYPIDKACPIALKTVMEFLQNSDSLDEVVFVLFDPWTYQGYEDALKAIT